MERQNTLLLILGGVALAALATQASATGAWWSGDDVSPPLYPVPDQDTTDNAAVAIQYSNDPVSALLAVIRKFEANNEYNIVYGHPAKYPDGHFYDYSRFPFNSVSEGALINLPGYEGLHSTASGAYQINLRTYNDYAPRLGITDFTPESQDLLGLAILQSTGAADAVLQGDITTAFHLASRRWASLPGSSAGQNSQTMAKATSLFDLLMQG